MLFSWDVGADDWMRAKNLGALNVYLDHCADRFGDRVARRLLGPRGRTVLRHRILGRRRSRPRDPDHCGTAGHRAPLRPALGLWRTRNEALQASALSVRGIDSRRL